MYPEIERPIENRGLDRHARLSQTECKRTTSRSDALMVYHHKYKHVIAGAD